MKILIVEDEKSIAESLKKGLEMQAHVVDVAFDGGTGLDLAIGEEYDVIVLDRMLPELDGIELCQQVRAASVSTPILMLTARTAVSERVEGLEAGADDYLGKPFAFEEFVARVHALSRRVDTLPHQTLKLGDLELDRTTFEVTRAGKPISLSKKEFALLEFLMRHPGRVFSKEELAEQVWSFDDDVLPNTVQVYIGYLRNKIDRPFQEHEPLIQTVRGFGYKIQG